MSGAIVHTDANRIVELVAHLTSEESDASRIADKAVLTWHDIDAALSPIVGERGVAALYKRSLYLTRADYPWLGAAYDSALAPGDFAELHNALSQQPGKDVAAATSALLQKFSDLLTSLIGGSLTERLLRSVWDKHSGGHAAQAMSP